MTIDIRFTKIIEETMEDLEMQAGFVLTGGSTKRTQAETACAFERIRD